MAESRSRTISLGHGSGGLLTHDLVHEVFGARLANPVLDGGGDSALLEVGGARIAFTTDSFVVSPLVFPGGDIGKLAVCGTVNDLAVAGAVPRFLSLAVVLEEGFDRDLLERIADSIAHTAAAAEVLVVTGDTKVVEKGKGDGVYLNTAGVGLLRPAAPGGAASARPGDVVLVNGPCGDHGAVIVSARSGIELSSGLQSDCAPLGGLVAALYDAGVTPRFMRDPTRGGTAGVLAELARGGACGVEVDETSLPVRDEVRGVCELLGMDPLFLANEGKVIVVVPPEQAAAALAALRGHPHGTAAAAIGAITAAHPGQVVLRTRYGGQRLIDMPVSDPLPRIC
ncbi:MAG: hydrogenase expression/formation protein HypE [Deltaproteobacteria bacterium]|nr:hydrogenase expression/formation protein HypE [Deltaproteobacteria bacterium]